MSLGATPAEYFQDFSSILIGMLLLVVNVHVEYLSHFSETIRQQLRSSMTFLMELLFPLCRNECSMTLEEPVAPCVCIGLVSLSMVREQVTLVETEGAVPSPWQKLFVDC